MPREAEPSLNERSFIVEALREGLRLDGRALLDYRDMDLAFGAEYGQADLRLGKTRSVCGPVTCHLWLTPSLFPRVSARISAQVTAPFADRKFEGVFSISTEFSPMASPAFEVGR